LHLVAHKIATKQYRVNMEEQGRSTVIFHPIISSIQKIALYETKSVSLVLVPDISFMYLLYKFSAFFFSSFSLTQRFYLMGSNNTLTRFRVLKIDRMEPTELVVVDDKREYTQDEIKDLVSMIDMGNRTRVGQRTNAGGVARVVSAFGIVGKIKHIFFYHLSVDIVINQLHVQASVLYIYIYIFCTRYIYIYIYI